jgi:transcriptional regulator with XRE-family HTH domain
MGFRLNELMTACNMTEAQLAGHLDYTQQYINQLRRNEAQNPALNVLVALAETLHVPLWALFADAPSYTPNGHIPKVIPRFRIRELAARQKFRSLDRLAMLSNLSPSYVRRIAGLNPPNVRLQALRSLAEVLQVPVWALFETAPPYENIVTEPAQQRLPEIV